MGEQQKPFLPSLLWLHGVHSFLLTRNGSCAGPDVQPASCSELSLPASLSTVSPRGTSVSPEPSRGSARRSNRGEGSGHPFARRALRLPRRLRSRPKWGFGYRKLAPHPGCPDLATGQPRKPAVTLERTVTAAHRRHRRKEECEAVPTA